MVDVAVRLHTPVYLEHRNAGGLPALVSILASTCSTTLLYHSSKGQHHCGSLTFSIYPSSVEANYSAGYS
jgi:hypothetical protein